MENDPEKLPTHHAMVAIDYEELDTCDEFTDYLLQYLPTKKKRNPRNRTNNTNQHDTRTHTTNNATVVQKTKNGNILECAACKKNHFLKECTDTKAKAAVKKRDPDFYENG